MKYQKVTSWWVYVIKTPDNMYYPGCSGKKYVCDRWKPKQYKTTALYPYIEQYGWENLEKIVLIDGLTEEQALQWEDKLICMYRKLGCCINKIRSGVNRRKQYDKQYYQDHKEYIKQRRRQYYQDHKK